MQTCECYRRVCRVLSYLGWTYGDRFQKFGMWQLDNARQWSDLSCHKKLFQFYFCSYKKREVNYHSGKWRSHINPLLADSGDSNASAWAVDWSVQYLCNHGGRHITSTNLRLVTSRWKLWTAGDQGLGDLCLNPLILLSSVNKLLPKPHNRQIRVL